MHQNEELCFVDVYIYRYLSVSLTALIDSSATNLNGVSKILAKAS
jgi:hypothetical protein